MRIRGVLGGAALGAIVAYLFDPDRGRGRRAQLRDRILATIRTATGRAERRARKLASDAEGRLMAATRRGSGGPVDDATLADRVRSTVLGSGDVPAGEVHVGAADGVVTLRGELSDRALIERIVEGTRRVDGVRAVEDLLHVPGETPANKASALRASRQAGSDGPTGSAIE